jgi:methionyl-tRNA formyltransferase
MKILLFGTGPFAVPTFEVLIRSSHQILGLVTRPVEEEGKPGKTARNPSRDLGRQAGLNLFAPVDVNSPESVRWLQSLQADLFVVCDYGQILSADCLATARLGGINLHGSLLPRYRGAAPIHWAIYHGETTTGVSVIHMTSKLDGGPVLATAAVPVEPGDTTESLERRLAELGVQPVLRAIELLEQWDTTSEIGIRQDLKLATSARRLRKTDGQIDWSAPAEKIRNQVRAFQPWPGSYTSLQPDPRKQPIRLILLNVTATPANPSQLPAGSELLDRPPGTIMVCDKQRLLVQTGDGWLALEEVQPAGKRRMTIAEFLRGQQLTAGMQFQ